ncbi:hypothetical protein TRIHO_39080 [Tritonibacter horizontis]|uniref:Queuosine transporter n=2 Tax=Tritonibacter horizontis TaxID=1768241 RepID=A0A132BS78_9RHOB|nr:hypothetical protein TRIHO_39080 [Tritonibacter horizontis]
MGSRAGFNFGVLDMAIIVLAYILCHGMTAWIVNPIEVYFLGDITMFASLVYLPHGVRVLSVWLYGWRAILPLMLAALLSEMLFTKTDVQELTSHVLWISAPVGGLAALVSFELLRFLGKSAYSGDNFSMNWRQLMLVGILASVLNSVTQTIIFAGVISPDSQLAVVLTYALGDMIGQAVTMVALMLCFRMLRKGARARGRAR